MKLRYFKSFLLDFDKEEQWLNMIADKGLDLSSRTHGFYCFKSNPDADYIYNIRLLDYNFRHPESALTLRNIQDTGSELLFARGKKVYLRRKKNSGGFDKLLDLPSRMKYYKKLRAYITFTLLLVTALLTFLIKLGIDHHISFFFWICMPIVIVAIPLIPALLTIFRKISVLKSTLEYIEYDRYPTGL